MSKLHFKKLSLYEMLLCHNIHLGWFIFILAFIILWSPVITGESSFAFSSFLVERPEEPSKRDNEPWTLTADTIEHYQETDEYVAQGNVVLRSGSKLIMADYGRFEKANGIVHLKGNVLLRYGEDWIRGKEVTWNLETETGYVKEGLAYFSENAFYVQAASMEKDDKGFYILQDGFITTCNPKHPDWKITYNKLKVPPEGVAKGRGMTFNVGRIPVIYMPWGAFPVSKERQSGFLAPVVGGSELQGFELEIPYYWAINRSYDVTFFLHYLQERGVMEGAEFRWSSLKWGEGIFLAHYLRDEVDKDHLSSKHYSFETRNRYWIRGLASFSLPSDVEGRVKLDLASDKNFLKEFEKGSPSYDYTDNAFRKFLGTGLIEDDTVSARESNLYMMKRWADSEITMDTHFWDQEDEALRDTTIQMLPTLSFLQASTQFGFIPAYYDLKSSVTHFWREDGERGVRMQMAPGISYPLTLASIFRVTPSMSVDVAGYGLEGRETSKETDSWEYRAVPTMSLTGVMEMNRAYDFHLWDVTAVQHTIRPHIEYQYAPDVDQDDIPEFDRWDIVNHRNRLRYGITSVNTVKKEHQGSGRNGTITSYQEWLRLNVFQYYAFGEQKQEFMENIFERFKDMKEDDGFSDLFLELDITPSRYITLSYDSTVSPDKDMFTRHDLMVFINNILSGQTIGIDYRYREDSKAEEIIGTLQWTVVPWLTIYTYHDYSFEKKEMFDQTYGITYRKNCWAVNLVYEKEGEDQGFYVSFNLLGFGQVF